MGNKFMVVPTKAEDVLKLVNNLRKADIEEILAMGSLPLNSLLDGYFLSDKCYSAFVDNHIIGIFGFNKKYHTIWFLGSNLSKSVKKEWIKTARYYINHFLELSPILTNTVSINNKLHIKWLKRMGAIFSIPYSINNHYFQDFYIIKGE